MTTLRPMITPFQTTTLPPQGTAAKRPQFGNTAAAQVAGRYTVPTAGKILGALDFQDFAQSTLKQIMVLYAGIISSRLFAAAKRSWNEVREVATRDSLGYTFWFFATPLLQRAYLRFVAPKEVRSAIFATNDQHKYNLLARWQIPTSRQVEDRAEHVRKTFDTLIEKAGKETEKGQALQKSLQAVESQFKRALKHRNWATGLGMASTIGLLGVGVMWLNIHLTKKNVAEGKVGLSR